MSMGVNKIIALGNSGYEKARDIADQLVGVDVVISGRDFTLLHTGMSFNVNRMANVHENLL